MDRRKFIKGAAATAVAAVTGATIVASEPERFDWMQSQSRLHRSGAPKLYPYQQAYIDALATGRGHTFTTMYARDQMVTVRVRPGQIKPFTTIRSFG